MTTALSTPLESAAANGVFERGPSPAAPRTPVHLLTLVTHARRERDPRYTRRLDRTTNFDERTHAQTCRRVQR